MNQKQDLFPKLREIFLRRVYLFLYGSREGVSINFLQKKANGIFLSTEEFMIRSKFNYSDLQRDLNTAKTLYKKVLEEHKHFTNERWNAGLELFP